MNSIWLLSAPQSWCQWARSEIRLRDDSAKMLRLESLDDIANQVSVLQMPRVNVMVVCDGDEGITSDLLKVIEGLSQYTNVNELVVATAVFEPGVIGQLFGAGVTEVVNMAQDAQESAAEGNAEGVPIPEAENNFVERPALNQEAFDPIEAEVFEEVEQVAHKAPVVSFVSGRGGVGKSVIAAGLAVRIAGCGLRCALIDADFGFGCLYELLGVESPIGFDVSEIERLGLESFIEQSAMRVAPGLTLWGPCSEPEYAEVAAARLSAVIEVLRQEADILIVDTPSSWTESAAVAVGASDRCVLTCDKRLSSESSLTRAIELACKLGLPRTKLLCLINRVTSASLDEENAVRLEMQSGVANHMRIPEADTQTFGLMEVGKMIDALERESAYVHALDQLRDKLLVELGLKVPSATCTEQTATSQKHIHLPWNKTKMRR